ncbi:MAG: hypothetical protein DRH34_05115 [Deltaproteobacteria bacterium]|nr:MAG: hypothetical protein DRH34_05115 [Deltaproteobacteria bacterium]
MYNKILFGTCLTEYCDHIFNFAINLAIENNAKLWIYHGLGSLDLNEEETIKKIKDSETRMVEAYAERMKNRGFSDYMINVSDGDQVDKMSSLAKDAGIDAIVIGTSTKTPLDVGEGPASGSLGLTATEMILKAPCSVIVVPPSLLPGLAKG